MGPGQACRCGLSIGTSQSPLRGDLPLSSSCGQKSPWGGGFLSQVLNFFFNVKINRAPVFNQQAVIVWALSSFLWSPNRGCKMQVGGMACSKPAKGEEKPHSLWTYDVSAAWRKSWCRGINAVPAACLLEPCVTFCGRDAELLSPHKLLACKTLA